MSGPPVPDGTAPIESQVRRDLVQAFRGQLRADTRLVLLGHFLVLALAVLSLWENAPLPWLGWWAAAVGLTTLTRAAWHRAADHPGLTFAKASDEHGTLQVAAGQRVPALGESIRLIPGHCDPTVNLYDWLVTTRGGVVEDVWPVTARGCLG